MANAILINADFSGSMVVELVGGELSGDVVFVTKVGSLVGINHGGNIALVDGNEIVASAALAPYISSIVAVA